MAQREGADALRCADRVAAWGGVDTMTGDGGLVGWLVASIFLLMLNATANCWELLKEIGDRQKT